MNYFRYRIPYQLIYSKINEIKNINHINFFIDLSSIARGLYSKTVQYQEINNFIETQKAPTLMIDELRLFLGELWKNFSKYSPKFIIFIDNGTALQTKSLDSNYKADRSAKYSKILEVEEQELHRRIKNYYFEKIYEVIPRPGVCTVIYDKNYEMDLLPHYCIDKGFCDSKSDSTINIILSIDKDLLQTCEFKNTFQATSIYSNKAIQMNLWDRKNCLTYIYKKFLEGVLTAKHLPWVLAIAGDKADNIPNVIKGINVARSIELISNSPIVYDESIINCKLPSKLEPYREKILNNLKLTSFELQIRRIPEPDLLAINKRVAIIS